MNYIKHLSGFFEKVSSDFDLNPTHISLYMSIFQLWNQNRFQSPICISRDELMRISKISSTATYHKCLRELSEKEYVKYMPSYNPFKGSLLEVVNLDFYTKPIQKRTIKKMKNDKKNNLLNNQFTDHVIEQAVEQAVNKHQTSTKLLPYINSINNTNIINLDEQKNKNEKDELINQENIEKKKKLREKKEKEIDSKIPPDWENIFAFFKEKKATEIDAQKFYNHFQSNGWLVGGKTKMKDWKAAARNWILNSEKFSPKSNTPQPNHLHTPNQKNYAEPL